MRKNCFDDQGNIQRFKCLRQPGVILLQGKKVEQIREAFNIVNDFTPEQEAQVINIWRIIQSIFFKVREENKWCEDS